MATSNPPVKVEITGNSIVVDGVDISRNCTAFTLEFDASDSRIPTLTVTLVPGVSYDGTANVTVIEQLCPGDHQVHGATLVEHRDGTISA